MHVTYLMALNQASSTKGHMTINLPHNLEQNQELSPFVQVKFE